LKADAEAAMEKQLGLKTESGLRYQFIQKRRKKAENGKTVSVHWYGKVLIVHIQELNFHSRMKNVGFAAMHVL
jgi:hypothetical protein